MSESRENVLRAEIQDQKEANEILKYQKEKLVSKARRLQGVVRCVKWESEDAEEACEEAARHFELLEDQIRRISDHERCQQDELMEVHQRATFLQRRIPNLEQEIVEAEASGEALEKRKEHLVALHTPAVVAAQEGRIGAARETYREVQFKLKQAEADLGKLKKTGVSAEEASAAVHHTGLRMRILNQELLEAHCKTQALHAEAQNRLAMMVERHQESQATARETMQNAMQEVDAELIQSRVNHAECCSLAKFLASGVSNCHEEHRSLKEQVEVSHSELQKLCKAEDGLLQEQRKRSMEIQTLYNFEENNESEMQLGQEETREAKLKLVDLTITNERLKTQVEIGKSNHSSRLQEFQEELDALSKADTKRQNEARQEGLRMRDLFQNEHRTRTVEVMQLQMENKHASDFKDLQREIDRYQSECVNEKRTAELLLSDFGRVQAELNAEQVNSRNATEAVAEVRDALLQSESEATVLRSAVMEFQQHLAEVREAAANAEAAIAASQLKSDHKMMMAMMEAKAKLSRSQEGRGSITREERRGSNMEQFEKALQALVSQEVATLRQLQDDDSAIHSPRQQRRQPERAASRTGGGTSAPSAHQSFMRATASSKARRGYSKAPTV